MTDYWSQPVERLLADLDATTAGLSDDEAADRLRRVGPNTVRRSAVGTARLVAAQLLSPIAVLLLTAAALSIGVGERTDGMIIIGALVTSAGLGFWQEHRAAGAVERLLALIRPATLVVRGGREIELSVEALVPGDVIRLAAGSAITADARLIEARDLFVDQSTLTGESFPVDKEPGIVPADTALAGRRNVVFAGTHVVSGTATAIVVTTGRSTVFGAIAERLAVRPPETEFERGVRRFGYLLLEITMTLVVAIFAINVGFHRPVLDTLLFSLALAVGLTPQLLPAIVSVTLARGAQRMARDRVIVRRLAAIEDLGGMEILCTDKTGTITEAAVAVHSAIDWTGAPSDRVRLLAYLNAAFETGFTNPIDAALRAAPPPGAEGWTKVDEIPYDFGRKRLSVVARDANGRHLLIVKGALRAVLDVCTVVEGANGQCGLAVEARQAIESRFEALSQKGYRCLGVAWRDVGDRAHVTTADERNLTFAGILSLADPLKPDAAEALRTLGSLGIRTILVTGDNRHVAARLASEAGLDASRVLTGADVERLSTSALVSSAPGVGVFAEMEPHQKERVILALRKGGHAVGYLGDGINDAAALHAADVGISVDSASDVTKQAADIVLLDKSLRVLADGVAEGRGAFANTLKYVFITTSANFGNMFSMAGASLVAPFLPLLPKQILLTNVLTDLPAMTIATDQSDPELVDRPRRWDNRGIGRFMLVFGLISSLFDFLTFGVLMWLAVPATIFRTGWFIESVFSELLILLVIRTRRPFFRSHVGRGLLMMSASVGVVTLVLPWTPVARSLGLAPLPPAVIGSLAVIIIAYTVCSDISKRVLLRWVDVGARTG